MPRFLLNSMAYIAFWQDRRAEVSGKIVNYVRSGSKKALFTITDTIADDSD